MLLYETRGTAKFYYSYDANGTLYSVSYTSNDSAVPEVYYYTHNMFGDIVGIYDSLGSLVAQYEYDSWGNIVSIKNASGGAITKANHIANLNPFRYRGYYYDTESGLYYLMSRYYDPVTHRFINADGYFQAGNGILDANMHAYCGNNPIMYSDPTGECPCDAPDCPKCNSQRRAFLQSEEGMNFYNKCHGTNYIGIDDKGNFISNTRLSSGTSLAGNCLNGIRTVEYGAAGAYVTTKGCAAGLSAIATVPVTALSIISHASNPYLTTGEKTGLIIADCVFAAGAIALSAILATTPLGWIGFAIGIGYSVLTTVGESCVENMIVENNKISWGYYE